jgi:zinc transport system substrate-binding protein
VGRAGRVCVGLWTRQTAAFLLVVMTVVLVSACSRSPVRKPGPLRVVVTVPALVGLIKPLLPSGATVTAIMPPGRSEHGYEPTPHDIATLGGADIAVYVGLGLEPAVESFLKKHPSKTRRDVCFAAAAGIQAEPHDHAHDDHGHDHTHAVDVHLWLDPDLCVKLIDAVAEQVGPAMADVEGGGPWSAVDAAAKLKAEIRSLDQECREKLVPLAGRSIVTHHNAWQRLADRYGLKVAAVIRQTDSEPTPGAIADAVDAIRKQGARAVFVEPQFDPEAAKRIADAAGVKLGVLDPLGTGDYFAMMRANVKALVEALGD